MNITLVYYTTKRSGKWIEYSICNCVSCYESSYYYYSKSGTHIQSVPKKGFTF